MSDDLERGSGRGLSAMVLRSSAWLVGARVGRILITLAGTAILARLLTPADFGLFFFATTALVLVTVILEGFVDLPITREDRLSKDSIQTLFWSSLALISALSAAVWILSPWLERATDFPGLSPTLRAIIPSFIGQVPLMIGTALLKRQHRFGLVATAQVLNVAIYIGLACTLVALDYGFWSLLIAMNAAQLATALLVAMLSQVSLVPPKHLQFPAGLGDAGVGALSRSIAWLWTNIDTFAVSLLFGPVATGLYSRAYNLNVQAKEPFAAVDQPIRQAFAAMKHREGGVIAPAVLALRLLTILSGLTAAAIIVLRDQIVYVLLGNQWLAAALPLAVLAASLPARVALLYVDSATITGGDMRTLLARNCAILAFVATGLFFFAPYGIAVVAAVVAVTLYASLAVSGLSFGAGSGLTLRYTLPALAPGMALGAVVVAGGAILDTAGLSLLVDGVAKLGLLMAVALATLLMTPSHWLPSRIVSRRSTIMRKFGVRA